MSYDRLGRKYQVTDAAGTRTFAYDASSLALATETFGTGMFNGKVIAQLYQDGTGGLPEQRCPECGRPFSSEELREHGT